MQKIAILGLGSYLPDAVMTNDELSKLVDTSDEWITTRTGIKERHLLAKGQSNTDMGREAAVKALADAGLTANDITHVLYATCTGDYITPSAACLLCDKLGITGRYAIDINAACSGCLFSLVVARGLIAAQPEAKILLVAAEALSHRTNWQDRSTCVLFGDGASALVLGAVGKGKALAVMTDIETGTDGSLGPLLHFGGPCESGEVYKAGDPVGEDYFISMNGRDVYKHAVRNMAAISRDLLARNNMTVDDVDMLVPHQANMRIIEAVGSRLEIPVEKVYVNLPETGNTSAASIPLAIDEARRMGKLKPGMRILTCTFGGGLTWSAALFQL
ncbi:3-oxoacyl-(acyl-carrier-protein) synthase III [uncultured delta proteobacterium]|uniref:Beta-ketoacyl-[acyl-carrier-protein] synthase III n=1 Tax=uncultured delta proteobacterium TaxID=34034 RepID=A0A212KC66_9DELT|nr:3-oxoacyl-(acyl-carrier-protein) synthase III [uncultured delta proteobacterium]